MYILAVVLWFAVTVMGAWYFWSIANAETSVESQDNDHYRKIAKGRGEVSDVRRRCASIYSSPTRTL